MKTHGRNILGVLVFFTLLVLLLFAGTALAQSFGQGEANPEAVTEDEVDESVHPRIFDLTAEDPKLSKPAPAVALDGQGVDGLPGFSDSIITLGIWAPRSGQAAIYGALARGLGAYFRALNTRGGVHGRTVQLLYFDNKYDPAWTAQGVKDMVEHYGVFAMVGGVGAEPNLTVLDYLAEKNIPWIGPLPTLPPFGNPERKNVFAVFPQTAAESAALVKYSVEVLNRKRIAIIYQKDAYGLAGLDGARRQADQYGLKLLTEIPISRNAPDAKSQIVDAKEAAPETILLWVQPVHAIIIRKTEERLQKYGARDSFDPVWMAPSTLADSGIMDRLTGGRWEGTIFTAVAESPQSKSQLMSSYYKIYRKYAPRGERWGPFFYTGFGLGEPIYEALSRCGPKLTQQGFVEKLEGLQDFKGILGRITFGPEDRQGQTEMYICRALEKGKVRPLTGWFEIAVPPEVKSR